MTMTDAELIVRINNVTLVWSQRLLSDEETVEHIFNLLKTERPEPRHEEP